MITIAIILIALLALISWLVYSDLCDQLNKIIDNLKARIKDLEDKQ